MSQTPSVLETLFPGVSRARFLEEYWLGERHLVAHGDPARFAPLFDPTACEDLRTVLRRQRGNTTASQRDRRGQQCHLHQIDADEARELYECGATLHLDEFELNLPGAAGTGAALAAELGLAPELLRCTAFTATVPGPGSPIHCDNKDIFIIQLEGAKRWRVGPNREVDTPTHNLSPWSAGGPSGLREMTPTLTEIVLEPGSTLFLPRGQWHETEVLTEGCFAITNGYQRPTWLQLLQVTLHNHLRGDASWRAAIGSAWGTPAQRAAVRDAYATRLRRLADDLARVDPDALLGLTRSEPPALQRSIAAQVEVTETTGADGTQWGLTVRRGGREERFTFDDASVMELVRWLLAHEEPFTRAGALARFAGLDRSALGGVLDCFVEAGLLDPVQPLAEALDLFRVLLAQG